jgi:hypothetical protein
VYGNYSRRAAIASGIALLAGCSGSPENDPSTSDAQPSTNGTTQDIPDIDATRSYGESVVDGVLEITVKNPTVETSVLLDEDHTEANATQVDLPDREALAVAPLTFTNRHETDTVSLFAPNFVLVGSELRQEEIRSIQHPQSNDRIYADDVTRFDDFFFRWTTHGSRIEPSESVNTATMFEVPEETTTEDVAVVYDSGTWRKYVDDLYGTTTARWMDSQ